MPKSKFTAEEDIKIRDRYISGETSQSIARSYGVYKQSILNSLKRMGVDRRKKWKRASGKLNGNWRGGVRLIKGYRHVYLPNHWLSRSDGWVAIHRLKMEKRLENKKQVVHHKDGNKINNKKSNLVIYENNGIHRKEHAKYEKRDYSGRWFKEK